MKTRIIKSINLNKEVPIVQFSETDGETFTDSTFPGKDGEHIPAAGSFEEAVKALQDAFCLEVPELQSGDRNWNIQSVTFLWNKEFSEHGFQAKLTGFKPKGLLLTVEAKESSPSQITPAIYAALEKLKFEAIRYTQGVSAQMSLLAIEPELNDEIEDEEEAA